MFVLPRSPYPPVKSQPATDANQDAGTRTKQKSPREPRHSGDAETATPDLSLKPRRRMITPVRITILVAVAVVVATGYWLHRRNVVDRAERAFVRHSEAGRDALKQGDHAAAKFEFEQAVAAAEVLERDDDKARRARQMFRECTAIVNLSPETLFGILEEAAVVSEKSTKDWQKSFEREFAGKWLVLDTTLRQEPATGGVSIDYPLDVGGHPVEIRGGLEVYDQVSFEDVGYRRVILAVQLKSCERSEGRWIVEFDPASAFLWSNYDNLLAVGFAVAPESRADAVGEIDAASELRQLLDQQSQLVGLKE